MSVLYFRDKKGNLVPIMSINGKSAYEIAVDNGFEGTEAEWLESLKSTIVLTDKTLTQSDQAADAKATGTAINAVKKSATTIANEAKSAASTAIENASEAKEVANTAFDMATSAQSTAATAKASASVASSNATKAKQTAEKALQRSGGTMTGDIDMDGNKVTGLGEPVNEGDAIPMGYVVPPEYGGTGKATLADALIALLASGAIVLTSDHYGDVLPDPGTPGRLFFKKVST